MTACIWSTPPGTAVEQFPAVTLLRFMHNHHLLQILDRPQWLTCKGGSRNYVERILSKLPPGRLHTSKTGAVQKGSARRVGTQWAFKTRDGQEHVFDKIVFATHADTSLEILDAAIDEVDPLRKALSAFKFSKNKTVTHSDKRVSGCLSYQFLFLPIFLTRRSYCVALLAFAVHACPESRLVRMELPSRRDGTRFCRRRPRDSDLLDEPPPIPARKAARSRPRHAQPT